MERVGGTGSRSLSRTILIAGAGFGGLTCALALERALRREGVLDRCRIVLVDRNDYHLYTPNLYEAATATPVDAPALLLKRVLVTPIAESIRHRRITFLQDEVREIDFLRRRLYTHEQGALSWDVLVVALGAEPADFGIPGLRRHALPLKGLEDAIAIRRRIWKRFQKKAPGEVLQVVVGGAGPTGVEFAGEVVGYLRRLQRLCGKPITPQVHLVEAGPTLLPGMPPGVVSRVTRRLGRLGVSWTTGQPIVRVTEEAVYLKGAPKGAPKTAPIAPLRGAAGPCGETKTSPRATATESPGPEPPLASASTRQAQGTDPESSEVALPYDVFIWAGGIQASPILRISVADRRPPVPRLDARGRVQVAPDLRVCFDPPEVGAEIPLYAVGDGAVFEDPATHRSVPATAHMAIEEAQVCARNILADLTGRPRRAFRPGPAPIAIPVGGKYAVFQVGSLVFGGFGGWLTKQGIELFYLLSITTPGVAFRRWLQGLFTLTRND